MHYSNYRDLAKMRSAEIFDAALPIEQRIINAREEMAALDNNSKAGFGEALAFAVPFGAIAAYANKAIKEGLPTVSMQPGDIEKATEQALHAVVNKKDISDALKDNFKHYQIDDNILRDLSERLDQYKEIIAENNYLKKGTIPDNFSFDKKQFNTAKEVWDRAKEDITHTISNNLPKVNDMVQNINEHFPGGVKGAAVVAATVAGLMVATSYHFNKKLVNDDIKSEIRTELGFAENEILRREINDLKDEMKSR